MYRLFGAAALLFSTYIFGRAFTSELRRRPEQLRQLIDALEHLRAEIAELMPLGDALRQVSICAEGFVQEFFRELAQRMEMENARFHALWEAGIETLQFLRPSEQRILMALGTQLGRFDAASQLRALDRCIEELTSCKTEAKEKAQAECGLRLRLTAALGALLLIMIW